MFQSGATVGSLPPPADESRLDLLLAAIGGEPVSDEMLRLAAGLEDASHQASRARFQEAVAIIGSSRASRRWAGSMARTHLRSPRAARGHG